MFIYNVTVKVAWHIHTGWLNWMRDERIPEMLLSKLFHQHQMVRLLEVDDTDGPTYAIQYATHKLDDYREYISVYHHVHDLQAKKKWKSDSVEFTTLMQVVD